MSGSCAAIAPFNPFLSHPEALFMLPVQSFGPLIGLLYLHCSSIFPCAAYETFVTLFIVFLYILSFPWQIQFEQNQP